jgi:hypothetical protein
MGNIKITITAPTPRFVGPHEDIQKTQMTQEGSASKK